MPDKEKLRKLLSQVSEVTNYTYRSVNDIDVRALSGDQPIHVAAFWGNVEDLEILLKTGADINSKGEDGYTPLHEAVDQDNYKAIKFLLEYGADQSIINDFGDTALEIATSFEKKEIIQLFSEFH